jgi:hypothetical protein
MSMQVAKKAQLEQRAVIGLSGLLAVTLLLALNNMGLLRRRAAPATVAAVIEGVNPTRATLPVIMQERQQQLDAVVQLPQPDPAPKGPERPATYAAHELRDPMESLLPRQDSGTGHGLGMAGEAVEAGQPREAEPPKLELQGFVWQGREPQAIINNTLVRVGESVGGATIVSIERRGVTVEYRGTTQLYTTIP